MNNLEVFLKENLSHYANFNDKTYKWEIFYDDLVEMFEKFLESYQK